MNNNGKYFVMISAKKTNTLTVRIAWSDLQQQAQGVAFRIRHAFLQLFLIAASNTMSENDLDEWASI